MATTAINPALLPLTERHAHTCCAELHRAIVQYKRFRTLYARKASNYSRWHLSRAEHTLVNATINAARALHIANPTSYWETR